MDLWSEATHETIRDSFSFMGGDSPVDFDVTFLVLVALFVGLMYILNKILYQPYLEAMDLRTERIQGAKGEAVEAQSEADEVFGTYEDQVAAAFKLGETERHSVRQLGKAEERAILDTVRSEIETSIKSARADLDDEIERAEVDLHKQAAALSKVIVEKVLA